jgi:hypothetical protein
LSYLNQYLSYKRLLDEHEAWSLLRKDHAALILALIQDLFVESNEISFTQARIELEVKLNRIRQLEHLDNEVSARDYLYQWIKAGWLRELNDQLNKTDACDIAMRFIQGLQQRETGTTASDLQIVQDAVKKLLFDISQDPKQRIEMLKQQQKQIGLQIKALEQGKVDELTEQQQRERITKVHQLAAKLSLDFRLIEDEILQLDQKIRREMIEQGDNRGQLLKNLFEQENVMLATNAGQAFESFFNLLSQSTHCDELNQQLQFLLEQPIAQYLEPKQKLYLGRLIRELVKESQRIFDIRKRTNESLRSYMESGAIAESARVSRLLQQLEQAAMKLVQQEIPIRQTLDLSLMTGSVQLYSPLSLKIKQPDDLLDNRDIVEKTNMVQVNPAMLKHLDNVQVRQIARKVKQSLKQHGALSVAKLVELHPIEKGLEELVAYLRIAKAVKAIHIAEVEKIYFRDQQGIWLEAKVPRYILNAQDFPEHIEQLVI